MNYTNELHKLADDLGYPLVTIPGYDDACMGYQVGHDGVRLCYSVERLQTMMEETGMAPTDAEARVNELDRKFAGPQGPIFVEV